jgi:hypothetical protein
LITSFSIDTAFAATSSSPRAAVSKTTKSAEDKFIETVAAAGVTYKQLPGELDITIDEKTAVAALPGLQAEGVIPKIAAADIARAPLGMSVAVVGVSFTVVILDAAYAGNTTTDALHVQAFVVPTGSKQKQLCYTFNFDRSTYQKMDLNTLTPKSFMLTTPEFTFTDWCRTNMEKEAKK